MAIEMNLQDALGDSTTKFKDYIKDFNSKINDKTSNLIQQQL